MFLFHPYLKAINSCNIVSLGQIWCLHYPEGNTLLKVTWMSRVLVFFCFFSLNNVKTGMEGHEQEHGASVPSQPETVLMLESMWPMLFCVAAAWLIHTDRGDVLAGWTTIAKGRCFCCCVLISHRGGAATCWTVGVKESERDKWLSLCIYVYESSLTGEAQKSSFLICSLLCFTKLSLWTWSDLSALHSSDLWRHVTSCQP